MSDEVVIALRFSNPLFHRGPMLAAMLARQLVMM